MNWIQKIFVRNYLEGEVKQMTKYKTLTKIAVLVLGAVATFLYTPAGLALVRQYPHLSDVVWVITTLAALLHVPVKKGN